MIFGILQALQYLYDHNLVHGNINPKNIFFTDKLKYKILDNQFLTQSTGYVKLLFDP